MRKKRFFSGYSEKLAELVQEIGFLPACALSHFVSNIQKWNANVFPLLKAMGFADSFTDFYIYQKMNPREMREAFMMKYAETNPEHSTSRQGLRLQANSAFDNILANFPKCDPWENPVYELGKYADAIIFDKEKGLGVDKEVFLKIHKSITEAKQSELYKAHENVVNELNTFLPYVESWEDVQRFISIRAHHFAINPDGVTTENYMQIAATKRN